MSISFGGSTDLKAVFCISCINQMDLKDESTNVFMCSFCGTAVRIIEDETR